MKIGKLMTCGCALLALAVLAKPAAAQTSTPQFPDGAGKDTFLRVCGSCHSAGIVLGRAMAKEQWREVVANMVAKGAKGTPEEFSTVVDYLARSLPLEPAAGSTAAPRRGASFSGSNDKQVVDRAAASRGKAYFGSNCAGCHGAMARGGGGGPDLVRSVTVLHDRYGSTLGPFMRSSHSAANGKDFSKMSDSELADLSHYLHQAFGDTLRSGPYTKVLNVLTGDPAAGALYFNGAGTCNKCHSITGDLKGLASKYEAPSIQQRFLFPRGSGVDRVSVTVTAPDGGSVSGKLLRMDDFTIALKDDSGEYRSWKRTPLLKIEKHDPYRAHDELLDKYTDKDIHDVVAYLETLK